MIRYFALSVLSLSLLLFSKGTSAQAIGSEEMKPCPSIVIEGKLIPPLSSVEKRLVCGDPIAQDNPPNEGWRNIPLQQAKFHLTSFLQDRGYYHAVFQLQFQPLDQNTGKTDGKYNIRVKLGEKTRVRQVSIESASDVSDWLQIEKKRDLIGRPLTPSLLDELEKWVSEQLQYAGFACPEVNSIADPVTGKIQVRVETGMRQRVIEVTEEPMPGLEPRVLRRYDAFQLESWFDSRLLRVTENRNASQGVVQTQRLRKECSPTGVILKQETLPGLPRLLTAGIGANTEGVFLGKFTWRNTRLGREGSLLDLTLNGSARIQNFQANLYWYLQSGSRLFYNPLIAVNHRDEQQFESLQVRGRLAIGSSWDFGGSGGGDSWGGQIVSGPAIEFYRTLRGEGAPSSQFLTWESQINFKSHLFEYFQNQPQTGMNSTLALYLSDTHLFSNATAQRLEWTGQKLWNLFELDPPLWILGIRWGLFTVLTPEVAGTGTQLPATFLRYLGGSADLRGFSRQELPAHRQGGGLTSGFIGLEGRLSHTFPWGLDPFVFIDGGAIGKKSLTFDAPFYWSPGVGIRWSSPVGPIRATLAQGFSGTIPEHGQFYFSFGEEF